MSEEINDLITDELCPECLVDVTAFIRGFDSGFGICLDCARRVKGLIATEPTVARAFVANDALLRELVP